MQKNKKRFIDLAIKYQVLRIGEFSIITMADLIDYLSTDDSFGWHLDAMKAYRSEYGI